MTIKRTWTASLARRMGFEESDIDDLHQEALIAAWQKDPEGPSNYQQRSAALRLLDIKRGKPLTGMLPRSAYSIMDDIIYDDEAVEWWASGEFDFANEVVTKVRVQEAILTLPEKHRKVVYYRFYLDLDWPEVSKRSGYAHVAAEKAWRKVIAPILREALTS